MRLLNELAGRKLKATAEALGDGWRWIETRLESEWNVTHWFAVLKGQPEPPTDEDHAKLARLTRQHDELAAQIDDDALGGEKRDKFIAECERLDDEIERQDEEMYGRVSYTAEQKACSGCLVTIGDEGEIVVHQGLVRPADRDLIPAEPDSTPAGAPAPESGPAGRGAGEHPRTGRRRGRDGDPGGNRPGGRPGGREQTGGAATGGAQRLHTADL